MDLDPRTLRWRPYGWALGSRALSHDAERLPSLGPWPLALSENPQKNRKEERRSISSGVFHISEISFLGRGVVTS